MTVAEFGESEPSAKVAVIARDMPHLVKDILPEVVGSEFPLLLMSGSLLQPNSLILYQKVVLKIDFILLLHGMYLLLHEGYSS